MNVINKYPSLLQFCLIKCPLYARFGALMPQFFVLICNLTFQPFPPKFHCPSHVWKWRIPQDHPWFAMSWWPTTLNNLINSQTGSSPPPLPWSILTKPIMLTVGLIARPQYQTLLLPYNLCYLLMSNSLHPKDCSPPGSSVHGILQARILEWAAMPFSRGSSKSRDQAHVS